MSTATKTPPTKRAKTNRHLPDEVFRKIMSYCVDQYREDRETHALIWQTIRVAYIPANSYFGGSRLRKCVWIVSATLPLEMGIKPTREMYLNDDLIDLPLPNGHQLEPDGVIWGEETVVFVDGADNPWKKTWNGETIFQK